MDECCTGAHEFLQISQTREVVVQLCTTSSPSQTNWRCFHFFFFFLFFVFFVFFVCARLRYGVQNRPLKPSAWSAPALWWAALRRAVAGCTGDCSTTGCTAGWTELRYVQYFAVRAIP